MRKFIDGTRRGAMITGIMGGDTPDSLIAQIRTADYEGADGICIDLAFLKPEFRNADTFRSVISSAPHMPFMFYVYRGDRFSQYKTDESRQVVLLDAVKAGAHIVDVMGDLYDPSPRECTHSPEAIKKQMELIDRIHEAGAQVVMSSHTGEFMTGDEVLAQLQEFDRRGADVLKLVQSVNSDDELSEAIRTTIRLRRELKKPFIHLCGGSHSRLHRFLGPELGVSITFAIARYDERWPMFQPTIRAMKTVFDNMRFHIDDTPRPNQ